MLLELLVGADLHGYGPCVNTLNHQHGWGLPCKALTGFAGFAQSPAMLVPVFPGCHLFLAVSGLTSRMSQKTKHVYWC
ncbi:MAG: hypothetical protein EBR58_11915 [Betaproteobacteria bacterium]|nr:hypothetical protein [Betaproteobacteria bacterium]